MAISKVIILMMFLNKLQVQAERTLHNHGLITNSTLLRLASGPKRTRPMADMHFQTTTAPIKHWIGSNRRSNSKASRHALVAAFLCCSAVDGAQPERCPCHQRQRFHVLCVPLQQSSSET